MSRIDYGLGGFGDLRLKKGALNCTVALWNGPVAAFVGLQGVGLGRCSSPVFFAIRL